MSRHSQIYTSYEDRIVQHGEQVLLEKSDFLDDNYLSYFEFKPKNVSKLSFSELLEQLYKADHLCNTTLRKKELKRPMYTYEFEKRSKKLKEISDAKTVKDLKSITRPKVQSQEDNPLLYPHGKSSIPGERVVITKLDKVEVAKNRKVSKNAKILEQNLEKSVRRTSLTSDNDNEDDDLNSSRRSKKSDLESSMKRRSSVKSTDSAKEFTITSATTAKNASAVPGLVRRSSYINNGNDSGKYKSPRKAMMEKTNFSFSGTLPPPFRPAGKSMGKAIDINQLKDKEGGSPNNKDDKFDRSPLTDKENNWLNHHKIGLSKRKSETKIICLNILQSLLNTVRGYDYDKYAPYYDFIEMPQEEVDLVELIKSCNVVEAQLVEYEMNEFIEFFQNTPYFTKVNTPDLDALNTLYEEIQKEYDDENMYYDDFISFMNQFTNALHKVDPLPTNTVTTTSELKERKKVTEIREGMVVLNEKGGKAIVTKEEEEDKKYEIYNLNENDTKVYAKEKLRPLTCIELGVIVGINSDGSYNIMYANDDNNNYDSYVDDSLIVDKVKVKPFPDIEKSPYKIGDIAFCDNGYEASEYVIVDIKKDKNDYLYSLCYDNRYIIYNVPTKEISQSTHRVIKNTEGLRFTIGDIVEVNVVSGISIDSLVDISNGKIIKGKVKLSVSSNSVICSYCYDPLNNSCLKPVASHYNQLLIGESVLFQEAHGNVKDKFSNIHYDLIEYKGRYYWKDERQLLTINNDYIIGDKVIVKIKDLYELPGIIMDIKKKNQVNSTYKILLCNGMIMDDLKLKDIKTFDYYNGRKVLYIDEGESKFEIGNMLALDNCGMYCVLLERTNEIVGKIIYNDIVLYQNKHLKKGMKVKYGNHEGQICEITCDGNYNIFNSSVGTYSPNINYDLIQPDYGNEIEIEEDDEENIKKEKELKNNLKSLYNIGDKIIYNDECIGEINEINDDCSYNICLDDGSYLEYISNKTIYLMPDYSYENMNNLPKDEVYHLSEEVEMLQEDNKKWIRGKIHRIIDRKIKKYYTISSRIKNETVYYYNISADYLRKPKYSIDDKVYIFSEIQGKKIWCLGKIHRVHSDGSYDVHLSVNNISHHKVPPEYILSDFTQLVEESYEVGDVLCYNGYDSPKVCVVKKVFDFMYEIELSQSKEIISDAKESDLSRLFTPSL